MVDKAKMVRFSVRISEELNDWLDEESDKTGIPKSTLIYLAIDQYREKKEGLKHMPQMTELMKMLQETGLDNFLKNKDQN